MSKWLTEKYTCKSWEVREVGVDVECCACGRVTTCVALCVDYQIGVAGRKSYEPLCYLCLELIQYFLKEGKPVGDYFPPYNQQEVITFGHVQKEWTDDWM